MKTSRFIGPYKTLDAQEDIVQVSTHSSSLSRNEEFNGSPVPSPSLDMLDLVDLSVDHYDIKLAIGRRQNTDVLEWVSVHK